MKDVRASAIAAIGRGSQGAVIRGSSQQEVAVTGSTHVLDPFFPFAFESASHVERVITRRAAKHGS